VWLLKRLLLGLAATALLVAGKIWLEHTSFGHRIEVAAFEFLQAPLSPFTGPEPLPIIVVDISRLPGGELEQPTPRDKLREMLTAITEQRPKVVGLDIDFSPTTSGWVSPDDPKFFDFCMQMMQARKVPIFLGVYRARAESSDAWLGIPRFKSLAAAGVVKADTSRVPRWLKSDRSVELLPTLGYALANEYRKPLPGPPWWLLPLVETAAQDNKHGRVIDAGEGMTVVETLINYSKLDQLRYETVATVSAQSIREEQAKFTGRMVLLGGASRSYDNYVVPGRTDAIPGVYVLASAAYTLAREPLYELKAWVRFAIDLLAALVIMLGAARLHRRYAGKPDELRRRFNRFLITVILGALALGLLLVVSTGVMWLDFLLVILAILMHPAVETRLQGMAHMDSDSRH
jgi:CHASE2 domain-containing sensor protein